MRVCDGCTFTSEAPAQHAAEISDKQEGNDDSDSFTNTWSAALTLLHFFFPKEDFNRKEIKRVTLFQRKSSFSFIPALLSFFGMSYRLHIFIYLSDTLALLAALQAAAAARTFTDDHHH